jgi:hypothetical protein
MYPIFFAICFTLQESWPVPPVICTPLNPKLARACVSQSVNKNNSWVMAAVTNSQFGLRLLPNKLVATLCLCCSMKKTMSFTGNHSSGKCSVWILSPARTVFSHLPSVDAELSMLYLRENMVLKQIGNQTQKTSSTFILCPDPWDCVTDPDFRVWIWI